MQNKITVGVFWLCDEGGSVDVIYDTETYSPDWKSEFGDEFIVYEKSHEEVWQGLAEKFFDGRYKKYKFDDFPRGRVTYDSDEGVYLLDYEKKLEPVLGAIKKKIDKLFAINLKSRQVDKTYQSRLGRFNKA